MNWRQRSIATLAGAFLFASAAHVVEGQPAATPTSGASVLEWNARTAQLIVGPGGAGKVPPLGLVDLAIVHTAVYDAVNAVEGFPFRSYAVVADVRGPASGDAAVAAAGRGTLIALFPARGADIEAWYAASLAAIPDGEEKTNGIAVGEQTAAGILALRAARFFAMLSTATSDALIACWDGKYKYLFWRPVTAIRAGGGDPRLTGDPEWLALVPTPNHPEYPGAHGCLSGALTGALRHFFGTDSFDFTIDSNVAGVTTPVRTYSSFSQAISEVIDARVYGGMHYRSSSEVGARMGRKVARHAARAFRPACDDDDGGEPRFRMPGEPAH